MPSRDAATSDGGPFPFVKTSTCKRVALIFGDTISIDSEAGLAQSDQPRPATRLCITIGTRTLRTRAHS